MRKKMEWQWEVVCIHHQSGVGSLETSRAKVIGGWIINNRTATLKGQMCESMVFIPDRDHEWHIMLPVEQQKPAVTAKDFESPKT